VGMNFIDSWINKLMTRVGSLNVIRGKLVIAKTTTEDLVARLSNGFAKVMTPQLSFAA